MTTTSRQERAEQTEAGERDDAPPDFDMVDMLVGFGIAASASAQAYGLTALLVAGFFAQKAVRTSAGGQAQIDRLLDSGARGMVGLLPGGEPVARRQRDARPARIAPVDDDQVLDLDPALHRAQRLLIVGASDAGKTTLVQHVLGQRENVLVVDPHATRGKWGEARVIGAGRNYEAIGRTLDGLVGMMDRRYQELDRGDVAEGEHPRCTVVVDEWRAITRNVKDAGERLSTLLTEARKVNMDLIVATHSANVKALGIEGEGDLRDGFTVVRIKREGEQRVATIEQGDKPRPLRLPGHYTPKPAASAAPTPKVASTAAVPAKTATRPDSLLEQLLATPQDGGRTAAGRHSGGTAAGLNRDGQTGTAGQNSEIAGTTAVLAAEQVAAAQQTPGVHVVLADTGAVPASSLTLVLHKSGKLDKYERIKAYVALGTSGNKILSIVGGARGEVQRMVKQAQAELAEAGYVSEATESEEQST